jgi:ADP-heptose:LPS heptosyltransferase
MNRWAGIYRGGGIGDNLAACSPMMALKKLGYMTEMITTEMAGKVFYNNPHIDKISIKQDGDIPGGEEGTRWFVSRAKEYDLFANLSATMEGRHARHKNESAFHWRDEYRRKICAGSYLETAHDILGVPHDFGPLFFPTDAEYERAHRTKEKIGDYVAWVLGGSRPDKVYPYMSHAITRIAKELGMTVVLVGHGGVQFKMAEFIREDVRKSNSGADGILYAISPEDGSISPDGRQHEKGGAMDWPLRRSLTQTLLARVVVTPDTGIGWACAMEEMAKVVLVSHASAENITKHWVNTTTLHADPVRVPCWPCHRLHDDMSTCVPAAGTTETAACMADIGVEQVIGAVRGALFANVVPMRAAE